MMEAKDMQNEKTKAGERGSFTLLHVFLAAPAGSIFKYATHT